MPKAERRAFLIKALQDFRHSLSYIDALPQLTFLGLLVGALTGCLIVFFRYLIDAPLALILAQHSDNFESLNLIHRSILIFSGATLLALVFHFLAPKYRDISVAHVLDRIHNHQGKLPWQNWLAQFFGATVCMLSGQSVGREGPAVHMGAGAASQLGQWLRLPNNSLNTLIGCGVAAAISASFDTPMAGVIFAIEVIMMEYTLIGFVPLIMASVMGTIISQAALGDSSFISLTSAHIGETNMSSLAEIPLMIAVGAIIACCAGAYIRLHLVALRFKQWPIAVRIMAAGLITAVAAAWVPEIMGLGYDTLSDAMSGKVLLLSLLTIACVKLIVTPVVIGLGIPGGVIGPLLVIGACVGGAIGLVASTIFPSLNAHPSFYVMMGMAGMMAATLNAPLAALVTVLELTYNPNVIFPAMLVIVVACVITRQSFKLKGIFVEQLSHSGRGLDFEPAKQALRRAGVRSVMDTRFVTTPKRLPLEKSTRLLRQSPMWIIVTNEDGRYSHALRAAELANYLESRFAEPQEAELNNAAQESGASTDDSGPGNTAPSDIDASGQPYKRERPSPLPEEVIDLLEIPSRKLRISAIPESATLLEAMQTLNSDGTEILYVSGQSPHNMGFAQGIITKPSIENYYTPQEFRHALD